jgi:tetratricopeptide (TPR) repeat protein
MKKLFGGAALLAMMLPGFILGEKKPQEPFYRRYLVAGNPLDERIREQEKRVEADPKSADLRNDFGNLLAARRFPREAREQYEMAMKLDRHYFLAPYNLGLLYETQGEIGRAITAYEKSVDRNRGFPPSRFRLGRLYEKRGWEGRAIAQYARALQIDPGMRDPKSNPLIVDTRLLDRVSLENYPRDMATVSMTSDAAYSNPSETRKLPLDRTLSSEDLEPAPAAAAPSGPTPVKVIAPSTPPRREPVRPAPAQNPTPDFVVLPPEPTEPPATEQPTPPPYPFILGGTRPTPPPTPTPVPE